MIMVMEFRFGLPIPAVNICGTSNICKPPIIEVMNVYKKIGFSSGMVILVNTCIEVAPSTFAASNREVSIPIIPAISMIVVLPNHIRKFIRPTTPRTPQVISRNFTVSPPRLSIIPLTTPALPNNWKNNMENAAAIMTFGR